jgi:hypothetical protein
LPFQHLNRQRWKVNPQLVSLLVCVSSNLFWKLKSSQTVHENQTIKDLELSKDFSVWPQTTIVNCRFLNPSKFRFWLTLFHVVEAMCLNAFALDFLLQISMVIILSFRICVIIIIYYYYLLLLYIYICTVESCVSWSKIESVRNRKLRYFPL